MNTHGEYAGGDNGTKLMHTRRHILLYERERERGGEDSPSLSLLPGISSSRILEPRYPSPPPLSTPSELMLAALFSRNLYPRVATRYVDRDITRQQQLLSRIAFQYSCSRGERERMGAEPGGQLSRCIIQNSSKRNIAAEFRFLTLGIIIRRNDGSALFRKLAARKQIVARSTSNAGTRVSRTYIVFIFMRI